MQPMYSYNFSNISQHPTIGHYSQPPEPSLYIHTFFSKINFKITFPSVTRSPQWSLALTSDKVLYAFTMGPMQATWLTYFLEILLDLHSNKIRWMVQITGMNEGKVYMKIIVLWDATI